MKMPNYFDDGASRVNIEQQMAKFSGSSEDLTRTPMPSDRVSGDVGGFPGHGHYWKHMPASVTSINKDNAYEDYDCLDQFIRLSQASVLLCDTPGLCECLGITAAGSDADSPQMEAMLLDTCAWMSTGQLRRMQEGGDLHSYVDPSWSRSVDTSRRTLAVRQRGGGRAATFFVGGDEFPPPGGRMLDVKGCGVSALQKPLKLKATGFLSLADALKEFIVERAIRRVLAGEPRWDTVRCLAIIDTGLRWARVDPATGFEGDSTIVLLVRQAHSRLQCAADDAVYYSVAQIPQIESDQGRRLTGAFAAAGLSSAQLPGVPTTLNIQTNAPFAALVDFSHFYWAPDAPNSYAAFRMSPKAFKQALQLWGPFTIAEDHLRERAWGTASKQEAQTRYEEARNQLQGVAAKRGNVGEKPTACWTWFLELDDSPMMQWVMNVSKNEDLDSTEWWNVINGFLRGEF